MALVKLTDLSADTTMIDTDLVTSVKSPFGAGTNKKITAANLKVYTSASPALVTPNLGTPSAGVLTNCSGTAATLNIGGNAATVTIANEASDTSCFPLFATAATGSLGPRTVAGLTFNAATASLHAADITCTTATLGGASTDEVMVTGRLIFRTLASDPMHATPASRPAGSVGEVGYYTGKLYFCSNTATPVWELITSA